MSSKGGLAMAQPLKGVSHPPHSEPPAVQPTPNKNRQLRKPATPPPQQDAVKISSAGRAASASSGAPKPHGGKSAAQTVWRRGWCTQTVQAATEREIQ